MSGSGQVTHHDPAVLEAELLERGLVVNRHPILFLLPSERENETLARRAESAAVSGGDGGK